MAAHDDVSHLGVAATSEDAPGHHYPGTDPGAHRDVHVVVHASRRPPLTFAEGRPVDVGVESDR